jgi:hypothetical protein
MVGDSFRFLFLVSIVLLFQGRKMPSLALQKGDEAAWYTW